MRVIAGELRSRKLLAPPGETTRPTPDRLREALFSVLQPYLDGVVFYDLYAGSGAVGIEAISRGAARAVFVEADRSALAALKGNLAALGILDRGLIVSKKVIPAVKTGLRGIVFADPPYGERSEYEKLAHALAENLEEVELLLIQHDRRLEMPATIGAFERQRELRQGDNVITFYGLGEAG
ncbi:MAG: 16S rRNA (guanine(966)-N(2))-methyltransferase RsmD [Bryobacter sp.]